MLTLFQDGFGRDVAVLVVVHILIGALLAFGVAFAVDNYFGEAVTGLIGEYGQYDMILHVRDSAKDAAAAELAKILHEKLPGSRMKQGLTIAGTANFFISLTPELKTRSTLENLPTLFNALPGLTGQTLMIEPSVTIRSVHRALRTELMDRLEEIPGVRLAFRSGPNVVTLLSSADQNQRVTQAIQTILAQYQILEVRFPLGYQVDNPERYGDRLVAVLSGGQATHRLENVTSADQGDDVASFMKALLEMKRFLLSYASQVTLPLTTLSGVRVGDQILLQNAGGATTGSMPAPGAVIAEVIAVDGQQARAMIVQGDISKMGEQAQVPGYMIVDGGRRIGPYAGLVKVQNERYRLSRAIDESSHLLDQLQALSKDTNATVENAAGTLKTFERALGQLDSLQRQIAQLQAVSKQEGGAATGDQIVMSLLLNTLFKSLGGEQQKPGIESLQSLDVQAMQESLSNIAARVDAVQKMDIEAIVNQVKTVKNTLPQLQDEEIGRSVKLIDSYMAGQVIPGERIELLADASYQMKEIEAAVQEVMGTNGVSVFSMSVGVVNPDARATLVQVLQQVRGTIAGLLALVFAGILFILDYSTILSAMRRLAQRAGSATGFRRRMFDPVKGFGALLGTLVLGGVYALSGAEIPFLNILHICLVGAMIGWVGGTMAERFSPVDADEMMAGEALGMSYTQIMREILIPAGRPGILLICNRWRQQFRGGGAGICATSPRLAQDLR